MEETKETCEEKGGMWVEQDGAWMCKHPEAESPAMPSEHSEEAAM